MVELKWWLVGSENVATKVKGANSLLGMLATNAKNKSVHGMLQTTTEYE